MNDYYEGIKNKTVCAECGSKEMGFAYLYENGGAIKKKSDVLGLAGFTGAGNMLMIICKGCGLVAKSYAIGR